MTAYAIVQASIIALVVAWSAWYAARRFLPTATRKLQAHLASWLEQPARLPSLRRLGHALQPVQAASGGCGSSGCSACGACAPAPKIEAQPLVFHPRAKP